MRKPPSFVVHPPLSPPFACANCVFALATHLWRIARVVLPIKVNRAHQGRLACAKDGKMLYDSVYHRRVRYPCGRHARSMPLGLFSLTHAHRRASIVTPLYAHIHRVLYTIYIRTRGWGVCTCVLGVRLCFMARTNNLMQNRSALVNGVKNNI